MFSPDARPAFGSSASDFDEPIALQNLELRLETAGKGQPKLLYQIRDKRRLLFPGKCSNGTNDMLLSRAYFGVRRRNIVF